MELIDRYIEAVVKYLPVKQRPDIEKELRTLIEDMLQQRTGERAPEQADVEAVLTELGDPRKLTDNYRGTGRYLIGPVFFEIYWLVLRIVMAAAGGGVLIATAVSLAANPTGDVFAALSRILGSLFSALVSSFGFVTLIFALNERFNDQGREELEKLQEKWTPAMLPPKSVPSLKIKRGDPIAAIIFGIIALIIVNVNLDMIGIFYQHNGLNYMTPLFSDLIHVFIPWISLSIGVMILIEGLKLFTGRWTVSIILGTLVQKILGLVIALQMFADARILNSGFFSKIDELFNTSHAAWPTDLPAQVCKWIIIIAIIAFVIDLITLAVKSVQLMLSVEKRKVV